MCLAVPALIVERVDAERAVADLRGSRLEISTLLTPKVQSGDWVLLHTGFAIECLTPDAAQRLLGEASVWGAADAQAGTEPTALTTEAAP